jgi:transcriptional regulator with XRE-family HTH domain
MDCGRLIRAARRTRKVSQRELAGLAGLPGSTVNRVEAGRVEPKVSTLVQLLGALGYELVITDRHNRLLELDDEHDKLRDRAGRRFPAHLRAFKTPSYFDVNARDWWGWERIAWPFGPGQPPEYTYWQRPRRRPITWADPPAWEDAT